MNVAPLTKHVFMSYSRRDESTLRRIVIFLRNQRIRVWVDNEKLVPGTPIWELEIEKAIISAGALVVLLSPDSKDSPWVRREISYAEDYDIRIFPLLITGNERTSIPIRLTNHQRIDIRQNEETGLNSLSTALLFHLEDLAAREQKAEREAAEKAAKEKVEREAAEKAAKEKAEREAAEKAAKEKVEREAAEKTAKEKAEREAAEKAAKEKAKREAAEKAAKEKAEREAAKKAARQKASKIISNHDAFLNEIKPPIPNSIPDDNLMQQKPDDLPK